MLYIAVPGTGDVDYNATHDNGLNGTLAIGLILATDETDTVSCSLVAIASCSRISGSKQGAENKIPRSTSLFGGLVLDVENEEAVMGVGILYGERLVCHLHTSSASVISDVKVSTGLVRYCAHDATRFEFILAPKQLDARTKQPAGTGRDADNEDVS
jgi:hypothetical protein